MEWSDKPPGRQPADVSPLVVSDHALARRLERAEATASASFVETRVQLFPGSKSEWIDVDGAYAMYDGPDSPVTQTFGLGLFQPPTSAGINQLERFFQQRGAPVMHEVSPLADPAVWPLLYERRYCPIEFTSVMYLPLHQHHLSASNRHEGAMQARLMQKGEEDLWADTVVQGWGAMAGLAGFLREFAQLQTASSQGKCFLAEWNGRVVATANLLIHGGVALLAGASTIPEARQQGAQQALLDCRLRYAIEQGCDLAMMGALPGSASQRNAERQGFRIAYTRIKWQLAA